MGNDYMSRLGYAVSSDGYHIDESVCLIQFLSHQAMRKVKVVKIHGLL